MKNRKMVLKLERIIFSCSIFFIVYAVNMIAFPGNARSAIFYVDGSLLSSGNGTSWADAVKTIQEAVDAATNADDEIWIKQGVYVLTAQISVSKAVSLYGGFQGIEETREQRDWETNETVIDGNSITRCFSITAAATIDGVTVQNGSTADNGGAISISGNFTRKIYNCSFLNNSAVSKGGAIYNYMGSVTIINSRFRGNTANSFGGAIYSEISATVVTECIFSDNHTNSGSGGALYCNPTATVKNSVFNLNSAYYTGGAIISSGTFINCTFFNNLAIAGNYQGLHGNSLFFAGPTSNANVTNCIFWRDDGSPHPEIEHLSGSLSVSYSILPGGFTGVGILDEAPLFVDASNGDFHLGEGSPGIDDGNNDSQFLPPYDLDGKFRILDGDADGEAIVDMGAYELGRYVVLSAPNGGETWLSTEGPHSIQWISGDAGSFMKIEISTDSGSTWAFLIDSTDNDGRYDWSVTPPASRFCRLRVSSVEYPSVYDESDADFTIDLDSEPDGMSDLWELDQFGTLDRDGNADWDGDGLNDRGEFENHTDPKAKDTDADGMPDGYEVDHISAGLNPLGDDRYEDADLDGFCNIREYMAGTNPGDPTSLPDLTVIHVDIANTTEIEDGSRLHPFNTILEAVLFASSQEPDEIWVRQGTYALSSPIIIDRDVWLFGGFDGTENLRDQRDWLNHATVIDGQGTVNCFEIHADAVLDGFTVTNGRRAVTISASASEPTHPLITNCYFTGNSSNEGGAISTLFTYLSVTACIFENNQAEYKGGAIYNEVSVLYIDECLFVDNQSQEEGGAIYNDGSWGTTQCYLTNTEFRSNTAGWQGGAVLNASSSGSIVNCTFLQNIAESANGGGAIYNGGSVYTIADCDFISNSTGYGGGAINNSNSLSTIKSCLFEGNHADYVGGAIWNWQSSVAAGPIIVNNVFRNNSTDGPGGGICNSWSAPKITNCTFYNNSAAEKGGGIYNGGHTYLNESPIITNCILWEDKAPEGKEISNSTSSPVYPVVTYCDVQGGYSGTRNINKDPLFIDPDGLDDIMGTLDDDLHLTLGSPCIDVGKNNAAELPTIDQEGKPRIIDGNGDDIAVVDMGAYEFGDACAGDFDSDKDVDEDDLALFAGDFGKTDCSIGDPCKGDLDRDGDVDGSDLAAFAADFGRTDCPVCE